MASLGDLVLNLKLGNQTFAKNMRDSGRMAQQLALDTEKLTRSTLSQQDAANRLSQFLNNQTVQFKQQAAAAAESNLATVQARAANQLLAVELGNATVQANRLTQAGLALDRQLMEEQQQARDVVAALGSADIRAKQLAVSKQQLRNAVLQLRGENDREAVSLNNSALASLRLQQATAQLIQRSLQHANAKRAESAALQHFNTVQGLSVATSQKYAASLAMAHRGTAGLRGSSGIAGQAVQQLVFAVDDAASSFGTGGWSGAIRGSANNLSMLAGILGGPYGMAIAVAITAGTQLWMAFSKQKEEAAGAAQGVDQLTESLKRQSDTLRDQLSFRKELLGLIEQGGSAAFSAPLSQRQDDAAVLDKQIADVKARMDQLRGGAATQRGMAAHVDETRHQRWQTQTFASLGKDRRDSAQIEQHSARAVALDKEANSLGTELHTLTAQRRQMLGEIGKLQEQQSMALAGEMHMDQVRAQARRDDLARQKELERIERNKLLMSLERHKLESGAGLRKQLAAEIDPRKGRAREIADEARERMKQAALNPETFTTTRQMILRAAMAKLGAENGGEGPRGPEGLQRGSRELMERMRQRELARDKPKDQQADLLKQLLGEMQKGAKEEVNQTAALKAFEKNYVVVGAFD